MILGGEALDKLRRSHVAVFGLGGVGSYVTEALCRAGVGELTLIDGVASIVFASTLGLGVALSGLMVFAVEGSIALLASVVAPYLGEAVVNEITFVGSLLIVGISLNLLGITKLRILNMVPAILLPILLCRFM